MSERQEDLGRIVADAGIHAAEIQQRHRPVLIDGFQGGAGAAQRGVENISAVSRKSVPSTASEEITTVRVVA